jgi:hypothetical protein
MVVAPVSEVTVILMTVGPVGFSGSGADGLPSGMIVPPILTIAAGLYDIGKICMVPVALLTTVV